MLFFRGTIIVSKDDYFYFQPSISSMMLYTFLILKLAAIDFFPAYFLSFQRISQHQLYIL